MATELGVLSGLPTTFVHRAAALVLSALLLLMLSLAAELGLGA